MDEEKERALSLAKSRKVRSFTRYLELPPERAFGGGKLSCGLNGMNAWAADPVVYLA